jgi:PAS domain S-box-containing protein
VRKTDLSERHFLDAAPDAMVIVDQQGNIVLVNKQTECLFGYSREQLIGQPVEVLLPQRFRDRHPHHRERFSNAPRIRPMGQGTELYGQREDGTEFPVEISLSPIQSEQGSFVASAIRDATARRQLERSLTGILESSLNEIYIFDADSLRFIQVNEGARRNLGYSIDELEKLTPVDIKPEFSTARFRHAIEPLRTGERGSLVIETVHRRKDGSTYPVEVHLQRSLFDATPVFVAIVLDITERKQSETALRESHNLLERRVIERTSELQAAIKDAEQANAGKSRFLAAASHDLRQPLQSLGLYLSVITRQLDEQPLLAVCDKMRKSLDTMGKLLDALLDISKLDGGSVKPEKRDFPLREVLDRIVTGSIQQAREKGLELLCTGSDCVVHSDSGLLERVLENFVTNAIRYTEQGRVTIDCRCDANSARISVADTGMGIPEDDLSRIFEEYYQLDNPTRNQRKGLGLGLSIVRHIARLLDHPVNVSSTPGKGSTFSIDVPLGTTQERQVTEPVESARVRRRKLVVLLIDDDPAVVDATSMLLEASGIKVHSAMNGDDALAHVAAGLRPDLVVSDYRLPGYNGVEAVRRLRRAVASDMPTILMTGDTSGDEIREASLSNCSVLHKPVDTDRLIAMIESVAT